MDKSMNNIHVFHTVVLVLKQMNVDVEKYIAVSDNHLPGKGGDPVRIVIEITLHAVYQDSLVNITADQTIIIAFLVPIPVITIKTLVRQIHGPVDIGFDSGLIGSQRKEQFMHAAHMLAGLHRTVQCRILG